MTVYVLMYDSWDSHEVLGVYTTPQELAKALDDVQAQFRATFEISDADPRRQPRGSFTTVTVELDEFPRREDFIRPDAPIVGKSRYDRGRRK